MRRLFLLTFCVLIIMTAAGPTLASVEVSFQKTASVDEDTVLLGDIAVVLPETETSRSLANTQITSSPPPGQDKVLYARSIISALRHMPEAAGVRWQGSENIIVRRNAITLTQNELLTIIADYLAANRNKFPAGEVRFTSLRAPSEIHLPQGNITWRITPSRPSIAESSSFSIFFKVDNEPATNCTVRGRVEVLAPVAVSTDTIKRSMVIAPGDIKMVKKNILTIDQPILSPSQAVGMQASRTIGAGKVVELDELAKPPVIEEGELVKIIAGKGNLRITTKGIARSSGIVGDTIRVKNIRSNKLIHARIDGPGKVLVEF